MGQKTNIQWCDDTVNGTSGCDGCELWIPGKGGPCYAGNFHENRLAKSLPLLYAPKFDEVRLIPGRLAKAARWSDLRGTDRPDKPWLNGMPRVIFVGDMGDMLSRAVPFAFIRAELIDVARSALGSRHIWMMLTKQAARLAEFAAWLDSEGIPWPANVWPGTSVTRRTTLSRVANLATVGGKETIRFVSAEPLFESMDLSHIPVKVPRRKPTVRRVPAYMNGWCERNGIDPVLETDGGRGPIEPVCGHTQSIDVLKGLVFNEMGIGYSGGPKVQLVIVGGESGPAARPCDVADIRSIVRQCERNRVSAFVKQLGAHVIDHDATGATHFKPEECWPDGTKVDHHRVLLKDKKGGDWMQWPEDLRVRQFPAPSREAVPS